MAAARHRRQRKGVISKPALRRLCRRGGVKRISKLTYDELRGCAKVYLEQVLEKAAILTEYRKCKTVTAKDVVHGMKFAQKRMVYGC